MAVFPQSFDSILRAGAGGNTMPYLCQCDQMVQCATRSGEVFAGTERLPVLDFRGSSLCKALHLATRCLRCSTEFSGITERL